VDWAALAQQWMVMKTANTSSNQPQEINTFGIGGLGPGVMGGVPQQQLHHNSQPILFGNNNLQQPVSMGLNFQPGLRHNNFMQHEDQGRLLPPGIQPNSDDHSGSRDIIGEAPMEVEPLDQHDSLSTLFYFVIRHYFCTCWM